MGRRFRIAAASLVVALSWSVAPADADQHFQATLTGAQQVPPADTSATGVGTVVLDATETSITVSLTFSGLSGAPTGAHIHGAAAAGANAGIVFDLSAFVPPATSGTMPAQPFSITPTQVGQLKSGLFYFNIHTAANSGGEIRGQILAAPAQKFTAAMTGSQETPPNSSTATGSGTLRLNATETQITIEVTFANLAGNATAAHVHGPAPPGSAAPIVFGLNGVPNAASGTIPEQTFSITPTQVTQLKSAQLYVNVHSAAFPDGEIRGQILFAPTQKFSATLGGWQQVPRAGTPATGAGSVVLSAAEDQITVNVSFSGLTTTPSAAHIHGPAAAGANAAIIFPLTGVPGTTSGAIPEQTFAVTPTQAAQLKGGQLYFNVHTTKFPDGEIRGQIVSTPERRFAATLTGSQEAPPTGSAATGSGSLRLNATEDQITVSETFTNLSSNATMSHVHGPALPGANGPIIFTLDGIVATMTENVPDQSFAVTPTQVGQLTNGQLYLNVHSAVFSSGEIRGQLSALPRLTVTQRGSGTSTGAVTSSPSGLTCGIDCSAAYDAGTQVTLTAPAAAADSFFAGWTGGGCFGQGACVVSLDGDTAVTAVYTLSSSPFVFTDDPVAAGQTVVKALHIVELRGAINTLRTNNGLAAFSFTDPSLAAGATIGAVHIVELRTALDAVYTARGRPLPVYTDPTITAGLTVVRAVHLSELRLAVRLIE